MSRRIVAEMFLGLMLLSLSARGADKLERKTATTPLDLFEQRIIPIFKSPQPSSCVQCHLAAVDLKNYILPTQEQTFASLRDQGLIDLDRPEQSKILTLIRMGDKDLDKGARLIHEETRQAEYEAFAAWIKAGSRDPKLRDAPRLSAAELARPARPDEVIRHARMNRVVDSFVRNIWSQRMRCFPCHTPDELDESNPKHRLAIERHKEFVEKTGDQFHDRMHIFRKTPEETMQYLIERSSKPREGELPLVNLKDPRKSLLLLKPTSKLPAKNSAGEFEKPAYLEPVSHMGGLKMHVDDHSYKAFIAWIQDYSRVVGDQYTSVKDLPLDNWFASKHVILLREVPAAWAEGARVQLLVHRWNEQSNSWDEQPVAFTQGTVTPIRNVVGTLFLLGPTSTEKSKPLDPENAKLTPGKYLLKAFVDSKNRLADNPTLMLPQEDFVGELAITARWGEGFPGAEKISGKLLKQ